MSLEKIFNKLGIYDIFAVWFVGISVSVLFICTYVGLWHKELLCLSIFECLDESIWVFLIMSYFIGLILQEISSFLFNHTFDKNAGILKSVFEMKLYRKEIFLEMEKNAVKEYLCNLPELSVLKNNEKLDWYQEYSLIFNYCKNYLIQRDRTSRMDKEQTLSAMARSFSVYFAILLIYRIIFLDFISCCVSFTDLMECVIYCILMLLLFYRWKRFSQMRIAEIIRQFYYLEVLNLKDDSKLEKQYKPL